MIMSTIAATSPRLSKATQEQTAKLVELFSFLDHISPDLPPTQSLNAAKIQRLLIQYGQWSIPDEIDIQQASNEQEQLKLTRRKQAKERQIAEMIHAVDKNGNGRIELNEFLNMMDMEQTTNKTDTTTVQESGFQPTVENIQYVFEAFDNDRDGFISATELQAVLEQQGCGFYTEQQCKEMIHLIDPETEGGKMSQNAFVRMMQEAEQQQQQPTVK